jgi:hypothetical protein
VRRIDPFVLGHVVGALVVGAVAGAFLDLKAVLVFSSLLAANAAIGSLVCWWRPGFEAAGWKLWLMATFGNPLMLAAIAFSIDSYDCLVGARTGWNCLFTDAGPDVIAACLPSPLIGLAVRWWWRRGRAAAV